MYFGNTFLTLIFLFGSAILTGTTTAILQMGRIRSKEEFKKYPSLFFFQHFLQPLFGSRKWEGLFFTLSFSKHVLHLAYCVLALFILLTQQPFQSALVMLESGHFTYDALWVVAIGALLVVISLLADMLMKFAATGSPEKAFKAFSLFSSSFMTLFCPITAFFLKLLQVFFPKSAKEAAKSISIRDKILEVLYESELSPHLDPLERKLILSVASFKQRIVREVMVPRIDVLLLSEETSIEKASETFFQEGYSRIPIYQESVDHIIGVLLYKDVLAAFAKSPQGRSLPVKTLIKPVLYTPETKKISQLLQEFRAKQIHLAIVVDEYGGTEGIITIEDILEELVGEIADEYDIGQEALYSVLPSGGWIVDARMGILDMEKELGIRIPLSPEYDTLGGYIFHRAGSIPSKGWKLLHDDFDLEILSSDDRSIEKVRILPHASEPK